MIGRYTLFIGNFSLDTFDSFARFYVERDRFSRESLDENLHNVKCNNTTNIKCSLNYKTITGSHKMNNDAKEEFCRDLAELMQTINKPADPASRLGDVLQSMGFNKLLYARKKDDNFDIDDVICLSEETRQYLNVLQTEKLYHCRFCYDKNDELRCSFHKKYLFNKDMTQNYDEYIAFLNSDMGVISFIELYYTYLSLEFWKANAQILLRDLTGFSTIKSLLEYYNYETSDDVDAPCVHTMDTDDDSV